MTLSSIATECSAVTAALFHLQNIVSSRTAFLDEISGESLSCVMNGCILTLSVLEEYLVEFQSAQDPNIFGLKPLTTREKSKVVWNESEMKELSQQLQGHKSSITLLLTVAQR